MIHSLHPESKWIFITIRKMLESVIVSSARLRVSAEPKAKRRRHARCRGGDPEKGGFVFVAIAI